MKDFDFKQAVADARNDYRDETQNTTFIDGTRDDAREQVIDFVKSIDRDFLNWCCYSLPAGGRMEGLVDIIVTHMACSFSDPVTDRKLLYFDHRIPAFDFLENPALKGIFGFNHELGHLVMPEGVPDHFYPHIKKLPREEADKIVADHAFTSENHADGFAIARCLSKGDMTPEAAEKISIFRLLFALQKNKNHLTAQTIDALILDARAGKLAGLKPREIVALAERRADEGCPSPRSRQDIQSLADHAEYMVELGKDTHGSLMAAFCYGLSSSAGIGRYAQYACARLADAFLELDEKATRKIMADYGDPDRFMAKIARIADEHDPLGALLTSFRENKADIILPHPADDCLSTKTPLPRQAPMPCRPTPSR